jgi:putative hydrolase of the HAD superfamily
VAGGRLVAFDLGGVLVRICRDWAQGCAAAGISPAREPSIRDIERMRALVSRHQRGLLEHGAFCDHVSECLGSALTAAEVRSVHGAWILGEYAGVGAMLSDLRRAGHLTACLSNTDAPHWVTLARMPFFQGLHHPHASHLLGLEKPDPAIFSAFERAVGFSGERIDYFDDLQENCQAAQAAGWRVQRIDPFRETVPQIRAALHAWSLLS